MEKEILGMLSKVAVNVDSNTAEKIAEMYFSYKYIDMACMVFICLGFMAVMVWVVYLIKNDR